MTKSLWQIRPMMYKSQFKKTDPYDWCCGPGSHVTDMMAEDVLIWILSLSQSLRSPSLLLSWRRSAPPTCGSSSTQTPSTATGRSWRRRWSIVRFQEAWSTANRSTNPTTRSATWTPTRSTRSACCSPDPTRAALGPRGPRSGPAPSAQVKNSPFTTLQLIRLTTRDGEAALKDVKLQSSFLFNLIHFIYLFIYLVT